MSAVFAQDSLAFVKKANLVPAQKARRVHCHRHRITAEKKFGGETYKQISKNLGIRNRENSRIDTTRISPSAIEIPRMAL